MKAFQAIRRKRYCRRIEAFVRNKILLSTGLVFECTTMQLRRKCIRSLLFCLVTCMTGYFIVYHICSEIYYSVDMFLSCNGRCSQHAFTYLINNENICSTRTTEERIELMIMIFTEHKNYEQRMAIRNTWLTYAKNNTANVRYAFFLGNTKNISDHESIAKENKVHKDILKEDFMDSYNNLTHKTLMGFKWVVEYCAKANFVLKTDDDMFVNVPKLLSYLEESGNDLYKNVVGSCLKNSKPIRDNKSKWYISEEKYPARNYPGFCSGTGYLISEQTVEEIYNIFSTVPFLYLEDVYVGLCLRKLGGYVKNVKGFKAEITSNDSCTYKGNDVFTVHHITPEMLHNIWTSTCKPNRAERPTLPWLTWLFSLTFLGYYSCRFYMDR